MNPRSLFQLATIIKSGSLTRAAERLNVTQPTLTRTIRSMENRIGAPLLDRTRYGVKPTAIGARLGNVGNRIIEEAARADEIIRQWNQGYSYEVRIGVGPMLQFAVMNKFVEGHSKTSRHVLHFKTASAAYLLPELQRGTLDLLLAAKYLDMDQSLLIRETIFNDETRLMVGAKSRFYGIGREVRIEELAEENWLLSGASSGLFDPQSPFEVLKQPGLIFTGAIEMVTHLLRTTDAVVRMPVRMMLLSGAITQDNLLDVQGEAAKRDIAIWSTSEALDHPAVRQVRDELRAYFLDMNKEGPLCGVEF